MTSSKNKGEDERDSREGKSCNNGVNSELS